MLDMQSTLGVPNLAVYVVGGVGMGGGVGRGQELPQNGPVLSYRLS